MLYRVLSTKSSTIDFAPNELRFGVPPRTIPEIMSSQLSANRSTQEALEDARNCRDEIQMTIKYQAFSIDPWQVLQFQEIKRNNTKKLIKQPRTLP
jgi:hypothetical protein